MQNGIIKEVLEKAKEGKKTFYEVTLQDGTKMTTFDSKIMGGSSGDSLDFEAVVSGKYINLKDGWKLTKRTSSSTEAGNPQNNSRKCSDERASIEAQCAVKAVIELRIHDKLEPTHPLFVKVMDWLDSKIPTIKTSSIPESTPDQAFDKLESAGKPSERHFKNTGEFFTAAWLEKKMQPPDILKKLGITKIEHVNVDEAWGKL